MPKRSDFISERNREGTPLENMEIKRSRENAAEAIVKSMKGSNKRQVDLMCDALVTVYTGKRARS